jgi:hypothetical protein
MRLGFCTCLIFVLIEVLLADEQEEYTTNSQPADFKAAKISASPSKVGLCTQVVNCCEGTTYQKHLVSHYEILRRFKERQC